MPSDLVRELLRRQSGVLTTTQLHHAGLAAHDVKRLVRRRELTRMDRNVLLDHTGTPTWIQRAWAAVLLTAPSALDGSSALRAAGVIRGGDDQPIRVAVAQERRLTPPGWVVVRRITGLGERVLWHTHPPRLRIEDAVVDAAARAGDDLRAVGLLTDAVGSRHTTPGRLRAALDRRARVSRGRLIREVVAGLEEGADSVLEQAYLTKVERAHRLPRAARQVSLPGRQARHDAVHLDQRVVVEMDGRAYHSLAADRFRDLERDAATAAAGYLTVRLGWGQVMGQPCATAARMASLLRSRGWTGVMRRCPRCP